MADRDRLLNALDEYIAARVDWERRKINGAPEAEPASLTKTRAVLGDVLDDLCGDGEKP